MQTRPVGHGSLAHDGGALVDHEAQVVRETAAAEHLWRRGVRDSVRARW